MSILIFIKKSTIWAQSRLCASNCLEMTLVWSWSCTFKNGKKSRFSFFSYPFVFEMLSDLTSKWWKHADCTTGKLLSSSFFISWIFSQIFKEKYLNFAVKITIIYYHYHNHLLVVIIKPNSRSLNWIEDCFSLLF